jgi:hypothetical protein
MEDYANKMRIAKDTFRVQLEEFMRKCEPNRTDQLFCFVEGNEDKNFYNSKIRGVINIMPTTVVCRNKANVLKMYDEIEKRVEYKTLKIGYFVDKDFDPKCEKNDVYETPCHSIENLFVQEETVKIMLEDIFRIDIYEEDFTTALNFFRSLLELFHQKILFLNVWLCCQLENNSELYPQLRIDNTVEKSFEQIVLPNMVGISSFSEFETKEKIETLFSKAAPIDNQIFFDKIEFFKQQDHSYAFRGKFEVEFLNSFLQRLREVLNKSDGIIWKKKYTPIIMIEKNKILYQLADKVIIPQCLREYIQRLVA